MDMKDDLDQLEPHELAVARTELQEKDAELKKEWQALCDGLDRAESPCNVACRDILKSLLNPDPGQRKTAQQIAQDIVAQDIG